MTNKKECIFAMIEDCVDYIANLRKKEELYGFLFMDALYQGYDVHFAGQSQKFEDVVMMRLIDSLERKELTF
tara:strand:+ start:323 stop:538 length:216 start_codon:yes stop_codon:yes gene_type:complete